MMVCHDLRYIAALEPGHAFLTGTPMTKAREAKSDIEFHPLRPDRWSDLEKLFGERGACGGCWCMWWRLPRAQWVMQKGAGNKSALRRLVASNEEPLGVLAYLDNEPAGWCALAKRASYPRLANSRIMAPIDDKSVWSVTCFFVARQYRRRGLMVALLKEAVRFAAKRGAKILEGYPYEVRKGYPDVFYYTGTASAFQKTGFREVARRSPTRPIFRRLLRNQRAA
jgi:GNAT superfamily N-acetyltransferase